MQTRQTMLANLEVTRGDGSLRGEHSLRSSVEMRQRVITSSCLRSTVEEDVTPQEKPSEVAVEVFPPDIVKHHRVGRVGMGAEIVQAVRRERTEFHFNAPVHLLALFERGTRIAGESSVEGLPRSSLKDFERKLIFVPAGHRYDDWQVPRTLTRVIYFYLNPARLPMSMALGSDEAALRPRLFFEDATVRNTALKLAALIESTSCFNQLYFDALSLVLTHEIVQLAQGRPRIEPSVGGGLAPWQQNIILQYVEEHLNEQIPLATLADLAGLSSCYFCRAFKRSMGMPPHRYHMCRRVDRAKSLLVDTKISVTEIGLSVGFNDTSSFTAAFRKATDLTPTAYRRCFV